MATYISKCSLRDFVVVMVNKTDHLDHIEVVQANRKSETAQESAVDISVLVECYTLLVSGRVHTQN